jgi:CBS-domain-containing membrane protein
MTRSAEGSAWLPLTELEEQSFPSDQLRLRSRAPDLTGMPSLRRRKVREVMTTAVVTVRPDAALNEATRRLRSNHVSGLPVVDGRGRLHGIVTETDVARVLGERLGASPLDLLLHMPRLPPAAQDESTMNRFRETLRRLRVRDAMTPDPVTIGPDEPLATALERMREERVNRLPVVKGRRVVGLLARQDLLTALLPV